ncbi:annexin A4 isoform X1 [Lates japonicus]|uniref:Annexin n=1 Tax=Lates japonicus TaxID=270547 RepID=A0AAD3MKN9_LATJO|nr:annexin A4 isoform X1 [Lates japonicus]
MQPLFNTNKRGVGRKLKPPSAATVAAKPRNLTSTRTQGRETLQLPVGLQTELIVSRTAFCTSSLEIHTLSTMAAIGNRGTVTEAAGFDPEADVQRLRGAMKGAGTDEAAVIEVLAHRTIAQRQRIKEAYKQAIGKDLADDLSSELSGNFRSVVLGLLMLAPVYDAYELKNAMKAGPGRKLDKVDEAQAVQDAKEIYRAECEARWGTDEVKFLTVLLFEEYQKISGRDIEDSIKREMSGCLEDVFLAIVKCMRSKPAFFAERLYKSMKGLGTTDSVLIRTMVARAEIDMLDIKAQFLKMYGKTLYSFIKGDTSGDYRKILLELCGGE